MGLFVGKRLGTDRPLWTRPVCLCGGDRFGPVRTIRLMGLLLVVVIVAAAAFWAGRTALAPPEDPLAEGDEPVTYVVEVGTVGRSLAFTAVAEWPLVPAGRQSGSGVVTSVEVAQGRLVDAGDVLYSVDLRPVVVAQGSVPMFRSLGLRDEGEDVAQVQQLLSVLGFYSGEVDGVFGGSTRSAVRDWQDSLGVDDTGVVEASDVVFVEFLPARIVLSESVTPGARLSDGEVVVSVVPDAPEFRIPLSTEQADLVPLSADVVVTYVEGMWDARIEKAVESNPGQLDLVLVGPGGGSVCGDVCVDWVDLRGTTNFRAEVIVIPETTGPVVPVGALSTDAANNPSVTLADGSLIPVTVIESANGIAVVDGVEVGTEILVLVDG